MERIVVVGIGRMGKSIAVAFGWAGHDVTLVDSEDRPRQAFTELKQSALAEMVQELQFLEEIGVISPAEIEIIRTHIQVVRKADADGAIGKADFVFEAVVELRDVKQEVYAWLSPLLPAEAIVSSTTSTMSANDLGRFVDGAERFVNGHWLNPAHLMPLVEVSPGERTSAETVEAMKALLAGIGKVPVVCRSSPGFIVPRIQALALNEAARLVEEGVASAEDVDTAVKVGFGLRFATLGLLEFIDWGGGDILFHATNYLAENLDSNRFSVPDVVRENMTHGRNGLRDGEGFYDWTRRDVDGYRKEKLAEFVKLLQHRDLLPGSIRRMESNRKGEHGE